MTNDATRGRLYTGRKGDKVVLLRRIPLCDEHGGMTPAAITVPETDALARAVRAAERLGAVVVGIYIDPADNTKEPRIFTQPRAK